MRSSPRVARTGLVLALPFGYSEPRAKKSSAVHVEIIKREVKGKTYQSFLLRRSHRDGTKVRKETLANLKHLPEREVLLLRDSLRGRQYVPLDEAFQIKRSLPHGHVAATLGTLRKLGLDKALHSNQSRQRNLAVALIVDRVLTARSKLNTLRNLNPNTATSTLAQELDLEEVFDRDLYEAMDWLLTRQSAIEAKLAKRHLQDGTLVLYDVSGSYYTGTSCRLAQHGYSRDKKRGLPQIVYGLLTSKDGCPVAVEVFSGDTSDPKTLAPQIAKLRDRFGLKQVVFVADRGLLTQARIDQELRAVGDMRWITAMRAPAIQKLAEQGVVQMSSFDERDLAEVVSEDHPGERLVACRNPLLADRRRHRREDLLKATEVALDKIVVATQRARAPLRGEAKIALRVGKVLDRHNVGKHFKLRIEDDHFSYERDEAKIERESALDGVYVVRTSVEKDELNAEEVVRSYKSLSQVEEAFRCFKQVDLRVRPIYHRLEERVRAHVLICMLAYYVEWHMRRSLAPILFEEDDPEGAEAERESVVAPAKRSASAKGKARDKVNSEGEPVCSLRGLLEHMGTLCRNRVRQSGGKEWSEFDMLTEATPLQSRALELLGVST